MILNCQQHKHECRWRRRKEARPDEILDAALRLFTEKGFSSTRMIDIARSAGISKGTLYLYFESKEQIFKELVQTVLSPMVDEAENALKQFKGGTEQLIREFVAGWWQNMWHSQIAAIPKLMISEAGNFPELAEFYTDIIVKRVRLLFKSMIEQGIHNNEFKPCNTDEAARLLMAPVIHATIWKHSLKQFDDDMNDQAYIELHLEIFLSGIKKES